MNGSKGGACQVSVVVSPKHKPPCVKLRSLSTPTCLKPRASQKFLLPQLLTETNPN